jgi:hypothetical protein
MTQHFWPHLLFAIAALAWTPAHAMGKRPPSTLPPSSPNSGVSTPLPDHTSPIPAAAKFTEDLSATLTRSGVDVGCDNGGSAAQVLSDISQNAQVSGTESASERVHYKKPNPNCDSDYPSACMRKTSKVATVMQFIAPETPTTRTFVVVYLSNDQKTFYALDVASQTLVQVNTGTLTAPVYQGQWQNSSTNHCGGQDEP